MKFIYLLMMTALVGMSSCHSQQKNGATLDAVAFQKMMSETKDATILDVRTPEEFADGFIANAVNLNYNDGTFSETIKGYDKNKTYFVYCLSGGRSSSAANEMRSNGFTHVYDLKGGVMAWQSNQFPLVNSPAKSLDQMSMSDYEKLTNSAKYVLIDFYAPWCGPCKKIEPIVDQIAEEYKGKVIVQRINIDENRQLAAQLGIDEIPFIKIYAKGKIKSNYIGIVSQAELTKNFK